MMSATPTPAKPPRRIARAAAQEVFGPTVNGYYVAAYACPVAASGREFVGYYKICRERPVTYWDALECIAKGAAPLVERNEFLAIEAAIENAAETLRRMP